MENLNSKIIQKTKRPIKVIQFGEGNFLRAFVDYMIDVANVVGEFVKAGLSNEAFWGEDLVAYEGMKETVVEWLALIKVDTKGAVQKAVGI